MKQRPFKVLGLQQIAIGGESKDRLKKLWVEMFGLDVTGTYRSERENVDEDICSIGTGPSCFSPMPNARCPRSPSSHARPTAGPTT
jgi:hypothetical protein